MAFTAFLLVNKTLAVKTVKSKISNTTEGTTCRSEK
jgi:hypothetical protein